MAEAIRLIRLPKLAMQEPRGFAEVNGTRLYYEVAGAGPPLVLIHGFSLDSRMWDDQFEAFAQGYRVIRYDVRGFGKSPPPGRQAYTHADDLDALLRHLEAAPADIVGFSMGGGIAIDFALANPEAVRALIPADATLGGYRWSREWDLAVEPVWETARSAGVEAAREIWLNHPLFGPAHDNPAVAPRLKRMIADYAGWHWSNRDPARAPETPAMQQLGRIRAPTLAILGERDLPDFHRIADTLQQHIPNARKVVLPGAGHMSNMEAPEKFNPVVLNFLAEAGNSL